MNTARISGLYKMSVAERIAELQRRGCLSASEARDLSAGRQLVAVAADKMIENVVGVFGLPLAIAPNFVVNGRETIVPLVVEEPSIVAGLSGAAALARSTGGFAATISESLLVAQIHVVGIRDAASSMALLTDARDELIAAADAVHPRLRRRGGGVRGIEFRELTLPDGAPCIAAHVLVDTSDAMGANLVNTIAETLAPKLVAVSGGDPALRILSNLTDRSICSATVTYPADALAGDGLSGEAIRDRIVLANDIANVDPYRAATHNKGIMNGIDALAIATGNDWRAIEAGAHAYAAQGGQYSALTTWSVGPAGELVGEITLPLKPATVGGTLSNNPGAVLGLSIAAVRNATELAELMAAVGLAQNFAALRALAGSGIQKGHMRLHARSVASAAGADDAEIDDVVDQLVGSGEVGVSKAAEILADRRCTEFGDEATLASAAGKIILLGEHAVVYGRHALAVPIPNAVRAAVRASEKGTSITIKEWGLRTTLGDGDDSDGVAAAVRLILDKLNAADAGFEIGVSSSLPRGMGLGSSAAIAVAITRALADFLVLDIDDQRVNTIALDCEKLAHGTPSGIDNTVSCFAAPMLFRNSGELDAQTLMLKQMPPLVIGFSHQAGPTLQQVAGVRSRFERDRKRYNAVFDQIGEISNAGAEALVAGEYDALGLMMNLCHGLLNSVEVSTPALESMVAIARDSGALGAKLTGAGGGGSIVALCPGSEATVRAALNSAGYDTLLPTLSERALN